MARQVRCRTGGSRLISCIADVRERGEDKAVNILDNAGLFAMVRTGRLALRKRQILSWASRYADSNFEHSKVVHDSFSSDSRMRHRHLRNCIGSRHDVGTTTSLSERSFSNSGVHSERIGVDVRVSVCQSGAQGIPVPDPTVAHDRLLSHLPGKSLSSDSRRWGIGGAAPVAPPHGSGPNVHR